MIEDVSFGPLNLGRSQAEALKDAEETLETLGALRFRAPVKRPAFRRRKEARLDRDRARD